MRSLQTTRDMGAKWSVVEGARRAKSRGMGGWGIGGVVGGSFGEGVGVGGVGPNGGGGYEDPPFEEY